MLRCFEPETVLVGRSLRMELRPTHKAWTVNVEKALKTTVSEAPNLGTVPPPVSAWGLGGSESYSHAADPSDGCRRMLAPSSASKVLYMEGWPFARCLRSIKTVQASELRVNRVKVTPGRGVQLYTLTSYSNKRTTRGATRLEPPPPQDVESELV